MLPEFDDGEVLLCPGCHETYLHQEKIEVFDCPEDQVGIRVVVENQTVLTDKKVDHNPSQRRQGLLIHFSCEHCSHRPTMAIWQHKGQTFMSFEADPHPNYLPRT
ncbi:MAG: hypothetical protein IT477_10430 [Rhodanobacteraceae bacterium]|nr:hypothetical protein [Rhodanobacteraceae bacterium]